MFGRKPAIPPDDRLVEVTEETPPQGLSKAKSSKLSSWLSTRPWTQSWDGFRPSRPCCIPVLNFGLCPRNCFWPRKWPGDGENDCESSIKRTFDHQIPYFFCQKQFRGHNPNFARTGFDKGRALHIKWVQLLTYHPEGSGLLTCLPNQDTTGYGAKCLMPPSITPKVL